MVFLFHIIWYIMHTFEYTLIWKYAPVYVSCTLMRNTLNTCEYIIYGKWCKTYLHGQTMHFVFFVCSELSFFLYFLLLPAAFHFILSKPFNRLLKYYIILWSSNLKIRHLNSQKKLAKFRHFILVARSVTTLILIFRETESHRF